MCRFAEKLERRQWLPNCLIQRTSKRELSNNNVVVSRPSQSDSCMTTKSCYMHVCTLKAKTQCYRTQLQADFVNHTASDVLQILEVLTAWPLQTVAGSRLLQPLHVLPGSSHFLPVDVTLNLKKMTSPSCKQCMHTDHGSEQHLTAYASSFVQ